MRCFTDPVNGETGRRLDDYVTEIVQSGFPALRHLSGRPLRAQLDGYIDRDFPDLGHPLRNPGGLRRWMTAYAAATSTTATFESVRAAATSGGGSPPAKTTAHPYREVLKDGAELDVLPGAKNALTLRPWGWRKRWSGRLLRPLTRRGG